MMKDFIPYKLAVMLKGKGFSKKTFGVYMPPVKVVHLPMVYSLKDWNKCEDMYSAPTFAQVLEWLRKEKCLHVEFISAAFGYTYIVSRTPDCGGTDVYHAGYNGPNDGGAWDDCEDCVCSSLEYVVGNLI